MKKKLVGYIAAFGVACLFLFLGHRFTQPDRPADFAGTWLSEETQGRTRYRTTVRFEPNGSGDQTVLMRRSSPGSSLVEEDTTHKEIGWYIRDNVFYINEGPWGWQLSDDRRVLVLTTEAPFNYTWTLTRQ